MLKDGIIKTKTEKKEKKKASLSEHCKLGLNSHTRNLLNSRPRLNPEAQYLKN